MNATLNIVDAREELELVLDELENATVNELTESEVEELADRANNLRANIAALETVPDITVNGAMVRNAGTPEFNDFIQKVEESQTLEEAEAAREASTNAEVARIAEDLEVGEESDGQDNLQVLGQTKSDGTGDFVFQLKGHYGTGTDEKFGHVHRDWVKTGCISYEKGLEVVNEQQAQIEDFRLPLKDVKPKVNESGEFCFEMPDGRQYVPTPWSLKNIAVIALTSEWFLVDLVSEKRSNVKKDKKTGEKVVLFQRDAADAELLCDVMKKTLFRSDRIDQNKTRLFRTWKNGTLRAVLSEQYAVVNNRWLVEVIRELIPGGMLSHWRGDADTIYGNVLIPDTIRKEQDSEYGGMLSIGNSEIGVRRISTCPSVFRSICMNGCIWGGETGVALRKRHRGDIDLDALKGQIKNNLDKQIPLLNEGIDTMLALREFKCDANGQRVPMAKVIAELGGKLKLSKVQATGVIDSWHIEKEILGETDARTAFGVQAAITRFGQTVKNSDGSPDNEAWLKFDQLGGSLMDMDRNGWDKMLKRASQLTDDEVADAFVSDSK